MEYDEAVSAWGAKKLTDYKLKRNEEHAAQVRAGTTWGRPVPYTDVTTDPENVDVSFVHDEGFACCGGRNSDCYCSQATSPVAEVRIYDRTDLVQVTIPADEFDLIDVIREIVVAGGGTVTAPVNPVVAPPPKSKTTRARTVPPAGISSRTTTVNDLLAGNDLW